MTLISAWATPGSAAADPTDALTRLGVPNSSTNLFAWHPILAVLFFLFQTLATLSWVLDFGNGNRQLVKSVHVTLQFGSFACLIALLCVIVQWMAGTPQLTAIHHWLGVIATLLFLCNFMAGLSLGLATLIGRQIVYGVQCIRTHRFVGMSCLIVSGATILTGIQNFLPEGLCEYSITNPAQTNPGLYYNLLPSGCQIGIKLLINQTPD